MISTKELKKKSLLTLKGNWTTPVLTTLLFLGLSYAVSMFSFVCSFILGLIVNIPVFFTAIINSYDSNQITEAVNSLSPITQSISTVTTIALSFLVIPLSLGIIIYFLSFAKNENPKSGIIFDGYKKSFGNSILASILISVYTFLWSLLLIIPGIIKAYSYSMTLFILAENPKMPANEAITKSRELMDGHKWEYFVLQLSFIGWSILALFTCGIGYIWLMPYMQTTMSNFYLKIKDDHEETKSGSEVVLEQF